MASFAAKLWLVVGNPACEPVAYGSHSHAESLCYFFLGEPLFTQVDELLIAIQSLRMASEMSTSCEGSILRSQKGRTDTCSLSSSVSCTLISEAGVIDA